MIIELVKRNFQGEFSKNILTLFTGTFIAQVVPVLSSIVLARLYSPEDYGVFGLITSIVGISTLVANGQYHKSIVLPEKEEDAINALALSIMITISVTLFLFLIGFSFNNTINSLLGETNIQSYLLVIPFIVFFSTNIQNLSFWFNRKKQYKVLSQQFIVQAVINSSIAIVLGYFFTGPKGLVVAYLIAMATSVFYLIFKVKNKRQKLISVNEKLIKKVAKKYKDFFKYATVSSFFNAISNIGMPTIIIAIFNPEVAGMYFFASKIVRIPIGILLTSFSQVYYQKANELYNTDRIKLYSFTIGVQKKIAFVLFSCLLVLTIIAPWGFQLIFGEKWIVAGELVKYFAILTLFRNIYSPISFLSDILGKQKLILWFNVILSGLMISSMYISHLFFDFKMSILISSIVCSLCFIILNIYLLRLIKI